MKLLQKTLLLSLFTLALVSCGKDVTTTSTPTPYPTLPLGATGIALAPATGGNFEGKGTEPFWNADISASGVIFSRPGASGVETKIYETRQEEKDGMIIIKDAKGEFFITLKQESCTDGMSEGAYDYTASVAMGSENLKGCASKK